MALTIMQRIEGLRAAGTLAEGLHEPRSRMHQLVGDRDEQFAADLVHPYRLIFRPAHSPVPRNRDGGIDTGQVTAVMILEVVDYH